MASQWRHKTADAASLSKKQNAGDVAELFVRPI